MGGGWMILIVGLVCLAIIGVVVWLMMRVQKNQQTPPLPQQQYPTQRNEQGYQPSPEMYQEGEKQYTYPQAQYPQQERPPLD